MSLMQEVVALAEQGMAPREIVDAMKGRTSAGTVYVYLCKYRSLGGIVPLSRRGPRPRGVTNIRAALELEAEQRGMTMRRLVEMLLTAIVEDELFDAVLDDRKGGA